MEPGGWKQACISSRQKQNELTISLGPLESLLMVFEHEEGTVSQTTDSVFLIR
jgi:hypothetical protein